MERGAIRPATIQPYRQHLISTAVHLPSLSPGQRNVEQLTDSLASRDLFNMCLLHITGPDHHRGKRTALLVTGAVTATASGSSLTTWYVQSNETLSCITLVTRKLA